jgi:hypothetical protein
MNINSIGERREAVNAINDYDSRNGVLISQKAKHEKPVWWYILAVLVEAKKTLTTDEIVEILKEHELPYSRQVVHRFLRVMMNLDESIHPHRRNCGISCYDAVTRLGGIKLCGPNKHTYQFALANKFSLSGVVNIKWVAKSINLYL